MCPSLPASIGEQHNKLTIYKPYTASKKTMFVI